MLHGYNRCMDTDNYDNAPLLLGFMLIIGMVAIGNEALPEYGTARMAMLVLGLVALLGVVWRVRE